MLSDGRLRRKPMEQMHNKLLVLAGRMLEKPRTRRQIQLYNMYVKCINKHGGLPTKLLLHTPYIMRKSDYKEIGIAKRGLFCETMVHDFCGDIRADYEANVYAKYNYITKRNEYPNYICKKCYNELEEEE